MFLKENTFSDDFREIEVKYFPISLVLEATICLVLEVKFGDDLLMEIYLYVKGKYF